MHAVHGFGQLVEINKLLYCSAVKVPKDIPSIPVVLYMSCSEYLLCPGEKPAEVYMYNYLT